MQRKRDFSFLDGGRTPHPDARNEWEKRKEEERREDEFRASF